MSMYEQDKWQREGDNIDKLKQMKEKAIKDNDVVTFNAINIYERSGNDVTVLIKTIKKLYESSMKTDIDFDE